MHRRERQSYRSSFTSLAFEAGVYPEILTVQKRHRWSVWFSPRLITLRKRRALARGISQVLAKREATTSHGLFSPWQLTSNSTPNMRQEDRGLTVALTNVVRRPNILDQWPPLPNSSARRSATIASSSKLVQAAWASFTALTMNSSIAM